jgi:hypothetical protein
MALSSAVTWEIRTTGSDTQCGGGFKTGASGTDYSQQAAAQFSGTDLVVDATTNTKVTSATHNFVAADVGNLIQITAGSGWTTGFYEIVSVASNAATLDRSPAATGTTGGTWWEGGALASIGKVGGAIVTGNTVYIKSGTYSVTSASNNVAAGCFAPNVNQIWVEGYNATRGDLGTAPVLQASGISSFILFAMVSGADWRVVNLTADGASLTSSRGFNTNRGVLYLVTAKNCTNAAFQHQFNHCILIRCAATGCSSQPAFQVTFAVACEAYDNTVTGFTQTSAPNTYIHCISRGNTGGSSDGFNVPGQSTLTNCTSYGNGRHGFNCSDSEPVFINCIAEANGSYGFNSGQILTQMVNCATYNNTSGATNLTGVKPSNLGAVAGSGSFFTNAAGGDLSLNTTTGAGAALRAAGIPGTFPSGTTVGYLDIGAAQHADPASSGGGVSRSRVQRGM